MKMQVFWDIKPFQLVIIYRRTIVFMV